MKESLNKLVYIRFLNYLHALEDLPIKQLDSIEESLLDYITTQHSRGLGMLTKDIISLSQFGSPATLHKRLKNLIRLGYLEPQAQGLDNPRKFATPTAKTLEHYEQLSDHLKKALEYEQRLHQRG